ncbi:hypothetical protein CQW23_25918 [Capsicum baccatum]|uniref:Single-stranded DNA binding protein Ssb-like OB fold domain-containing protein n=1 Tax=Capsicum baccatum TaxID=33114 RepID=A0A2G2VMC7_CAPBA|nr:hypothetical protein CQW23_25918 [Capsicum baccatum]PHU02775.1 hypothetical protein BC332_28026 [Capsicum chinense]
MAEQKQKQQVGSKKVNELRPLDNGINITVKVISKKTIAQRNRLAECLVGDDTGIIIFTARNDQVDLIREDSTLVLTKAKVDMFKGSMRLAVDRFGRIEVGAPASFSVEKDINMSLIEFERVDVVV